MELADEIPPGRERLDDGHRDRARLHLAPRPCRPRHRRSGLPLAQPAPRSGNELARVAVPAKVFSAGRSATHDLRARLAEAALSRREQRPAIGTDLAAARAQATIRHRRAAVTPGGSPGGDNGRDALARRGRHDPVIVKGDGGVVYDPGLPLGDDSRRPRRGTLAAGLRTRLVRRRSPRSAARPSSGNGAPSLLLPTPHATTASTSPRAERFISPHPQARAVRGNSFDSCETKESARFYFGEVGAFMCVEKPLPYPVGRPHFRRRLRRLPRPRQPLAVRRMGALSTLFVPTGQIVCVQRVADAHSGEQAALLSGRQVRRVVGAPVRRSARTRCRTRSSPSSLFPAQIVPPVREGQAPPGAKIIQQLGVEPAAFDCSPRRRQRRCGPPRTRQFLSRRPRVDVVTVARDALPTPADGTGSRSRASRSLARSRFAQFARLVGARLARRCPTSRCAVRRVRRCCAA